MNEIFRENGKTIILFGVLYFVIIIAVIIFIWTPQKKSPEFAKYSTISEEEIDKTALKKYMDELIQGYQLKDTAFLYKNLEESYKEYTKTELEDLKLELDKLDTINLKIGDTKKNIINNTVIYSTDVSFGNDKKRINIIENYPGGFTYTFGTFYKYIYNSKNTSSKNLGFFINNIYQDMEYIKINMEIYNNSSEDIKIKMESPTDVQFILTDGLKASMNNVSVAEQNDTIKKNSKLKKELIFNIPIGTQGKIESIQFNRVIINKLEEIAGFEIAL